MLRAIEVGGRGAKTPVWPLRSGFIKECHWRKTFQIVILHRKRGWKLWNCFIIIINYYFKKNVKNFYLQKMIFWSKPKLLCVLKRYKLFYLQQNVDASRDISVRFFGLSVFLLRYLAIQQFLSLQHAQKLILTNKSSFGEKNIFFFKITIHNNN